ncbi:hypothetical protein HK097_002547 [Rhizophlyctis rosea]|uniref:Uncharacterized protein n=1 Tax=Rhizophlyctis rosea TaxID=64517 RepID=A0AAD5S381_9FUNG|nr:hypothetical protein HK097_002547 [Rhizophlyctis rosea]
MTTQPSLTKLPTLIYHEVAKHLAPPILHNYNIHTYLTLQHCCNPLFAHELRLVLKPHLQKAQAALASKDAHYVLSHPSVLKNSVYLNDLTFPLLCKTFDGAFIAKAAAREGRSTETIKPYTSLLLSYVEAKHYDPVCYPTHIDTQSHIVTMTILAGHRARPNSFGGSTIYNLWYGVEITTVDDGDVETYDWGISLLFVNAKGVRVRIGMLCSSSGDSCIVVWAGNKIDSITHL